MIEKTLIALVDDDSGVRKTLSLALRVNGYEVLAYGSAEEFFESYREHSPACLILDLRMPGMDGLEVQRRLKEMGSDFPVIFISGEATVPASVEALKLGAIDFLEKPFSVNRLLSDVEEALAKKIQRDVQLREPCNIIQRVVDLSRRERQVMQLATKGLSNKEVARELNISPRTVEHHRARVMKKMQAHNIADLCRMAKVCDESETLFHPVGEEGVKH